MGTESLVRKPVNLTLPVDVVQRAKELGLNLSQVSEDALRAAVRAEEGRRWQEENREAIEAHNAAVEKHGLPLKPLWRR